MTQNHFLQSWLAETVYWFRESWHQITHFLIEEFDAIHVFIRIIMLKNRFCQTVRSAEFLFQYFLPILSPGAINRVFD